MSTACSMLHFNVDIKPNDYQRLTILTRTCVPSSKAVSVTQMFSQEIEGLLDDGPRLFGVVFHIKRMLTLGVV